MGETLAHADYVKMLRWDLVKKTNWTFDYIDSLSMGQMQEILQIEDGLYKSKRF